MRFIILFLVLFSTDSSFAHSLSLHEEEMKKIIEGGDPAECLNISESELISDCIVAFAAAANDSGLCETDPSLRSRRECMATISRDASYCADLEGSDGDHCMTLMARSLENPELCNSIKGAFAHDRCMAQVAGVTGDLSLCERITDRASSTYALCFSAVALERRDADMCESISALSVRRECFRDIAEASADASICERIENKESGAYYGCLLRVGIARKDLSVCDALDASDSRSSCKTEITGSVDPQSLVGRTSSFTPPMMAAALGLLGSAGLLTAFFLLRKKHVHIAA